MKDLDRTLQSALACSEEELKLLVHHPFMKVISNLFCNSNLTENLMLIIVNRRDISPEILDVQWSLIRNSHTPLARAADFLKKIKTGHLSELYADPGVPSGTKPFIYRELMDREGRAYDPTR